MHCFSTTAVNFSFLSIMLNSMPWDAAILPSPSFCQWKAPRYRLSSCQLLVIPFMLLELWKVDLADRKVCSRRSKWIEKIKQIWTLHQHCYGNLENQVLQESAHIQLSREELLVQDQDLLSHPCRLKRLTAPLHGWLLPETHPLPLSYFDDIYTDRYPKMTL